MDNHAHVTRAVLEVSWKKMIGKLGENRRFSKHHALKRFSSYARIYTENAGAQDWDNPLPTFCASLDSRHAHGHVTRAVLCLARACAVEMHMDNHGHVTSKSHFMREFTQKIIRDQDEENLHRKKICENLQPKCRKADGVPGSNPGQPLSFKKIEGRKLALSSPLPALSGC